jgi:hypothetical protein
MQIRWSICLQRYCGACSPSAFSTSTSGVVNAVGFGHYDEVCLIIPHGPADVVLLEGHAHIMQPLRTHGRWRAIRRLSGSLNGIWFTLKD